MNQINYGWGIQKLRSVAFPFGFVRYGFKVIANTNADPDDEAVGSLGLSSPLEVARMIQHFRGVLCDGVPPPVSA